jgi:hypothetical protein
MNYLIGSKIGKKSDPRSHTNKDDRVARSNEIDYIR